jgi:hypothetical protein
MPGKTFGSAARRWEALGPYYAMFPIEFARGVIRAHTAPGGAVLDPFAGRATSVFAAAELGRRGCGIEINPVGWLYGRVKLAPATRQAVLSRLALVSTLAEALPANATAHLPPFFTACYAPRVLRFLWAARTQLDWKRSRVDATLMAITLVYLHGKRDGSLSNQMRQGKAMAPDYSVAWWAEHGHTPPDIDPGAFLRRRIEWRYKQGHPSFEQSRVLLGNSRAFVKRLERRVADGHEPAFNLLLTSPPYWGVTNYHVDQWLRLWMLGGHERPSGGLGADRNKFESREGYTRLLSGIFTGCAPLLHPDAVVYVRTDARPFTFDTTARALMQAFPDKTIEAVPQPYTRQTQTALFGDDSEKPGEVDLILLP